jgi:hypothetical protein
MTVKRAKLEFQCDNKNIVCYFFEEQKSIVEINGQEYEGYIDIQQSNHAFNIFIDILDYKKDL